MKRYINVLSSLLCLALTCAAISCNNDDASEGSLEIENDSIVLSDLSTTQYVSVDANCEWRLEYDTDNGWLSTDLMGGRAVTKGFTIEASQNSNESIRYLTIRVMTYDKSVEKEINVIQLSSYPTIVPASTDMSVMAATSTYKVELTMNAPDEAVKVIPSASWIENAYIDSGILYFTASENEGNERNCSILLEYIDENNRVAEASIKVSQAAHSIYNSAELVDFSRAVALPTGTVTDNICIDGIVTVTGVSKNMPANTYVIQSEDASQLIVLQSETAVSFSEFSKVRVALMNTEVKTVTEGSYSYNVITGLTIKHLLKAEDSEYAIPEVSIADITDDMAFRLVTLKDVEASIHAGAYTNFKTCWPGSTDEIRSPFYFVNQPAFSSFYRYYPVSLRDKNGDHIYMLSNLDVPWAHTTLPSGSGTVTGLLMRVTLTNFDIDSDQLCIVPLMESHLNMSESTNNVSETIAEWNCGRTGADLTSARTGIPSGEYNPDGGTLASQSGVVFNRIGYTGFTTTYSSTTLGFQDSFRGDANLNDNDDGWAGTLSSGYYGRVQGGAISSNYWTDNNQYYYIDGISTEGLTGIPSLQVEMNLSNGLYQFHIEWATSLDATEWNNVEGSDFNIIGQFDRTDAARQTANNVPGYKMYDFKLPEEILGQSNVCIRIRPYTAVSATVRMDHISLKINKQ